MLWVPKTVASIASILALGLIGVLALFAAAAGVWLSVRSRQRAVSLVAELQRDYDAAEALQAQVRPRSYRTGTRGVPEGRGRLDGVGL